MDQNGRSRSQEYALDTEFVQTPDKPEFVSAAFLTDRGHRLYAELEPAAALAVLERHPDQFVRDRVIPQLGVIDAVPWSDLPTHFSAWLDVLGVQDADVIYDYNADYLLVERLLDSLPSPPAVRLHPTHVGYLADDVDGKIAASSCWAAVESAIGIGPHHALADALALRAKFEAVHGVDSEVAPEPHALSEPFEVEAVVRVIVQEFELVHADGPGGLTVSIGQDTPGINWRELRVGQKLACRCISTGGTRVLHATVIADGEEVSRGAQSAA